MIGIYQITNTINGKIYVGQSVNIDKRVKEHFWKAFYKSDRSYECVIHQAIRKYGKDCFSWKVLEECSQDQLDEREKHYIACLDTLCPKGYNRSIGGQLNRAILYYCKRCSKQLSGKTITGMCKSCLFETNQQRRVVRPDKHTLLSELIASNFTSVGKKYNVSDNTIRNWCKFYNMSTKANDYN